MSGDDDIVTIEFDRESGRRCGDCRLCCRLLPVRAIGKGAGVRCRHSMVGRGCAIYESRPLDCRLWSCRWLTDARATAGMRRPDRSHYVIDQMPDLITITDEAGASRTLGVTQVWADPAHPSAKNDPALRAYVEASGRPALIRWNERDATALFPPSVSSDGEWHEVHTNLPREAAK